MTATHRQHSIDLAAHTAAQLIAIEARMRHLSQMFQGRAAEIAREIKHRKREGR
jgi:hypothetical protein